MYKSFREHPVAHQAADGYQLSLCAQLRTAKFRHLRTSPQIFGIIPKNLGFFGIFWDWFGVIPIQSQKIPKDPKNSWMKFFIQKIWDVLGWIPKDPKFLGVIWDESQKIWDHPKKIAVILGWFGADTRGSEEVIQKQKKHLYTSP